MSDTEMRKLVDDRLTLHLSISNSISIRFSLSLFSSLLQPDPARSGLDRT